MRLCVTLSSTSSDEDDLELKFDLLDTALVRKWLNCLRIAQSKGMMIDDPKRFYGMDGVEIDKRRALKDVDASISAVNAIQHVIHRRLSDIEDTDTLNYLHHIFEVHHGLLDRHHNALAFRQALSDLNIAVHRAESVLHGNQPRFVVTYFDLPKLGLLTDADLTHMVDAHEFGGLYLNYSEVGKTLEDLVIDDDNYIHPEAFQPWKHVSADFTVLLYDSDKTEVLSNRMDCERYFLHNIDKFKTMGYDELTPRLMPGQPLLGRLIYDDRDVVLDSIRRHQCIKAVSFED